MHSLYLDYIWEEGFPKGVSPADTQTPLAYRIIKDPYNKRISIERYKLGKFDSLIYDTHLLDFRTLSERNQTAWSQEEYTPSLILVRDIDDRTLYLEENLFDESGKVMECKIYSPSRFHLATTYILEDSVELRDKEGKLVGKKKYAVDENGVFRELIEAQGLT